MSFITCCRNTSMTPIENLIRTAYKTFGSRTTNGLPSENVLNELTLVEPVVEALNNITATSINLKGSLQKPLRAKVSHIHICETKFFSLGVFILSPGGRIPLHDHPGMFGAVRVIHGEIKVQSYSVLDNIATEDGSYKIRAQEEPAALISSSTKPGLLTPDNHNIHQIEYSRGEPGSDYAAFIDILSPPYFSGTDVEPNYFQIIPNTVKMIYMDNPQPRQTMELLACECPKDFFTKDIPYSGPNIQEVLLEENEFYQQGQGS